MNNLGQIKKVLILKTQKKSIQDFWVGNAPSHSYWGMIALQQRFTTKTIFSAGNIFLNTIRICREDFDVLFMHSFNPFRILPFHLIKILFPSQRRKKVVCLCHASIYGKNGALKKYNKYIGKIMSWMLKGYDRFLFFSPKSLEETLAVGIPANKCQLVHWGADLKYIQSHVKTTNGTYWLSSGKENRDYYSMEMAKKMVEDFSEIKILYRGLSYNETLVQSANCKGIIVIVTPKGLNYCTGLTCVMEALALGKPIISVRNPYFPFDIEKEGIGLYVNAESPNDIVDAISKLEKDNDLYMKMSEKSKKMAIKYNMNQYDQEVCDLIDSL